MNTESGCYNLLGREFLPELLHVVGLVDFLDHVQSLSDQFLLDDLQQFVLLQLFTGHVQWKIVRVDNSSDEGQVLGHHVLEVVSDEDTSHEELDLFSAFTVIGEHVLG